MSISNRAGWLVAVFSFESRKILVAGADAEGLIANPGMLPEIDSQL
jgi:hypothetical protein